MFTVIESDEKLKRNISQLIDLFHPIGLGILDCHYGPCLLEHVHGIGDSSWNIQAVVFVARWGNNGLHGVQVDPSRVRGEADFLLRGTLVEN